MKSIYQLIPDIYLFVQQESWQDAISIHTKLGGSNRRSTLRLSRLGPICPRAFWNSIHHPELAELLPPQAEIKYAYGHIVEDLVLQLAKATGHTVEGEQDELIVDGVTGHRDCVIDGCLCDIKSQSSRAIDKLKSRSIAQDDPFGYLDQLDGYSLACRDDPLVKIKDKAYLIGIDKTLGHMVLYEHECRHERIKQRIAEQKRIVGLASPPACECRSIPDGMSGNLRLDTKASYSLYKWSCHPNLRCFLYADGPKYLTKVVREPNVPEVFSKAFS